MTRETLPGRYATVHIDRIESPSRTTIGPPSARQKTEAGKVFPVTRCCSGWFSLGSVLLEMRNGLREPSPPC